MLVDDYSASSLSCVLDSGTLIPLRVPCIYVGKRPWALSIRCRPLSSRVDRRCNRPSRYRLPPASEFAEFAILLAQIELNTSNDVPPRQELEVSIGRSAERELLRRCHRCLVCCHREAPARLPSKSKARTSTSFIAGKIRQRVGQSFNIASGIRYTPAAVRYSTTIMQHLCQYMG